MRPFWPGADFESAEYPPGCVVIDNPPFSILARIVKFYAHNRIDFFLFSPYLINLNIGCGDARIKHVIAPCSVTYANGARVDTSFVTSLGGWYIRTAPDLMDALQAADDANRASQAKQLPKYEYPDAVITSARIGYLCKHHTLYALKHEECTFIRELDAGCKIFGGGFLLSERAAAERAAAERAAAERAAAIKWLLSDRELAVQRLLSHSPSNSNS